MCACVYWVQAFAPHARSIVSALVRNVLANCTELETGENALTLIREVVNRLESDAVHVVKEVIGACVRARVETVGGFHRTTVLFFVH